jgi:predicted ATPase
MHVHLDRIENVEAGELYWRRGDEDSAHALWREGLSICTEHGFIHLASLVTIWLGWVMFKHGQEREGIDQMRLGMAASAGTGSEWEPLFGLTLLAQAFSTMGATEQARATLEDVEKRVNRAGKHPLWEMIYPLKGELLLRQNNTDPFGAAQCFQTAIDFARSRDGKSLELRATTSLARILGKQGRRHEARTMLAEIYNWFTEGFDTADLKDARVLLDQLAI